MKVNNIIERAEKYRMLGRFDKTSAMSFINDALYDISKMHSIKRNEIFFQYSGMPIELEGKIIKVESIELKDFDEKDFMAEVLQDNKIILYKRDSDDNFKKMTFEDHVKIPEIDIKYVGFLEVIKTTEEIDFPSEFETAIVYFIRSKMLEEIGEIEQSQYFMGQYSRELIMKSAPKIDVISKPSKYSLL